MSENKLPYTFYAGEKASAQEVNSNFRYLCDAIKSQQNTINKMHNTIEILCKKLGYQIPEPLSHE